MRLRGDNPFWGWEAQVGEGNVQKSGEIHGIPSRDLNRGRAKPASMRGVEDDW